MLFPEKYSLLIKNGVLLRNGEFVPSEDIAISGRRIAAIGSIPESQAHQVIDASGCIVSPGLIDMHLHLAPLADIGVCGEAACFPAGVTTVVDCGSAGISTYEGHRPALAASRLNVFAFLNVCSAGLITSSYLENVDPAYFEAQYIREHFEKYGKTELLGLKIRQGAEIVGSLGLEPLKATIRLAEELGVPVMVHCSNPPCPMDELTALLRPGDILTHAFQDNGGSILDANGHVSAVTRAARERGVIFDVANANNHFSFNVARNAIAEGFLPDSISTDLTVKGLYLRPNSFNLLHIMSKYLNLGLTLPQVLERVTKIPAGIIGRPELGEICVGGCADIAILRIINCETVYGDRVGERITGTKLIKNLATVREGMLMFRDMEF